MSFIDHKRSQVYFVNVKRKPKSSFNEHYEAANIGARYEKVFLEILQNSQESTCVRVFFNIVQALGLQLY